MEIGSLPCLSLWQWLLFSCFSSCLLYTSDIATLTVLENFLNGFGGPVVTVSHDRYFLDKVANKILAFEEGGVREFFGNYTDYPVSYTHL